MKHLHLLSDHVYDWSARSIRELRKRRRALLRKLPRLECGAARLADRALQALWQAGVQMCRWSRSRPEVLPVGEFSWSADGLRAAGKSGSDPRARRQLPRSTRGARGGLRDQPRAVTAPRGALRAGGERNVATAAHPRRFRRCAAARQHGRGMTRRRAGIHHYRRDAR